MDRLAGVGAVAPAASTRPGLSVHGALLFVQTTFGAFPVVGKAVLAHVTPLQLAAFRVALAAPLLVLLARRVDRVVPPARLLPALAGLGFLGVFANQVLYVLGLQRSSASSAAILMLSIPVFVTALGLALAIERPTVRTVAGVCGAVAGAVVVLEPSKLVLEGGEALGNALLLGNCLAYAGYLVLQRPLLERIPPLTLVAWSFLFGGIGVLAVSARDVLALQPASLPAGVWVGIAYVVAIPTVVNYALNSWAIRRSSPALVAAYTTLQPLVAAALALAFLGEALRLVHVIGFALTAAGLAAVSSRGRARGAGAANNGPGRHEG